MFERLRNELTMRFPEQHMGNPWYPSFNLEQQPKLFARWSSNLTESARPWPQHSVVQCWQREVSWPKLNQSIEWLLGPKWRFNWPLRRVVWGYQRRIRDTSLNTWCYVVFPTYEIVCFAASIFLSSPFWRPPRKLTPVYQIIPNLNC